MLEGQFGEFQNGMFDAGSDHEVIWCCVVQNPPHRLHIITSKSPVSLGAKPKELNLLQLFPQFEMRNNQVNTLRIAHKDETLGVNTVEEAHTAESILAASVTKQC